MAEEISYYAIVNDFSSLEEPGGVLRRIKVDGGERDETFGSDLRWGRSALLYSLERGDLTNEHRPDLGGRGRADRLAYPGDVRRRRVTSR